MLGGPVWGRALARELFAAALAAVAPAEATRRALAEPEVAQALAGARRIVVVGAGKAGEAMADGAVAALGPRVGGGVVLVRHGHTSRSMVGPVTIREAGHPLPDEASLRGSAEVVAALGGVGADDVVLVLISGGASSLLALPPVGVELEALRSTGSALLASGAPIAAVNTVRRHLCGLKGGGLAALAAPARVIGLCLSDVVGDPLESIGSGPTVGDPTTFADAMAVVDAYGLVDRFPAAVIEHLRAGAAGRRPESVKPDDPRLARAMTRVIASGRLAAAAMVDAARGRGVSAELLSSTVEGEAREVGRVYAALARGLARGEPGRARPCAWVLAGETTVTLGGRVGVGGRNLEAALAAGLALDGVEGAMVACLASDGSDGTSAAAGALVDGASAGRARALGLDPGRALAGHDAQPIFEALGDLVVTGPTGTNVADLALVLAW